ncbi:MAG: hypothetical protein AAF720_09625 [Pseudomonadota bacterium]
MTNLKLKQNAKIERAMASSFSAFADELSPDRDVLPSGLDGVVQQIESAYYGKLPGSIPRQKIDEVAALVQRMASETTDGYFGVRGRAPVKGTFLETFGVDDEYRRFCDCLCTRLSNLPQQNEDMHLTLRAIRSGEQQASGHSFYFHYDSFVLTFIIPIIIPEGDNAGDLLIMPKSRNLRTTYVQNIFDKAIVDSNYQQKRFRKIYQKKNSKLKRIKLELGKIYVFEGYKCVHSNEAPPPGEVRSTAVLHYYDPHANDILKKLKGRLR